MKLRRGRTADVAGVLALEQLFPGDRMAARSVRHFLVARTAAVWVVTDAKGLVAALIMLTRSNSQTARIYSLAVHPRARGQGLAQRLVAAAELEARRRGRSDMSLEVRSDNAAARGLYAGLGYAERERLPGYYEDGAEGLRLAKPLRAGRERG